MKDHKPTLVIVQNRETQFDAPLYAKIHQSNAVSIKVIYTEPIAATPRIDKEIARAPQWDHLDSTSYPNRILKTSSFWAMARLASHLYRQKPDLVVICGYYPRNQLLLAVLLRLLGQRIGLRSDNTLSHTTFQGLRGRLRRYLVGPIQRLFHTWHPVGEQAHAYLRALSGTERPSYRFAYAVDNDWFAAQSSIARHGRAQFLVEQDWPHDAFVVLGIMKWAPREDPITLVAAFQQLRERVPRVRLILVGDGPLRDEVVAACQPLGNSVLCPGYVPYSQLPDWYGRADVFVHPAPDEPWGVSVTEALACGVPVIAAEGVGAAREVLQEDGCGGTFPNHNAKALMDALMNRATDVEASQLANACREAADRWHYRQTIEQFKLAMQTAEAWEVYRHG